ncbi:MAG TPA: TIGR04104 family putative zinc finger protein [Ureibacillus sp.]|nr:TIGR04104 family putative zinc finger protein [Ureibacillus sp.]
MEIQRCTKCQTKLKWFAIVKSIWSGYKPIQCSDCGKQYAISFKTRYKTTFSLILPLVLFGIVIKNVFLFSSVNTILAMLLFGVFITFLLPFTIKYNLNQ